MTKRNSTIVKELISEMDFEKVHKIFVEENFTWLARTPSIDEMKADVEEMILQLLNDPDTRSIETGRFEVSRVRDGELDDIIDLKFVPFSSHCYCPDVRGKK